MQFFDGDSLVTSASMTPMTFLLDVLEISHPAVIAITTLPSHGRAHVHVFCFQTLATSKSSNTMTIFDSESFCATAYVTPFPSFDLRVVIRPFISTYITFPVDFGLAVRVRSAQTLSVAKCGKIVTTFDRMSISFAFMTLEFSARLLNVRHLGAIEPF